MRNGQSWHVSPGGDLTNVVQRVHLSGEGSQLREDEWSTPRGDHVQIHYFLLLILVFKPIKSICTSPVGFKYLKFVVSNVGMSKN